MIPIPLPNWYIYPYHRYPQATGFNRGLLAFGDLTPPYSQLNRSLSFATYTETTHTNMSTTARIQPMPCPSPTHVYQMKGYTSGGYTSTVNKQQAFTNTESVPTITFATERRGGSMPMPHLNRNRMYYIGGYSDSLAVYTTTISWVTQNTETETVSSATLPGGRHLSATLFNTIESYSVGGYTPGGGTSSTNYRYTFATDATATMTADTYNSQNPCGFSSNTTGYRVQGQGPSYTQNTKYSFSSGTWAAAPNSPENNGTALGMGAFVNQYEGAVWGGYQSYFLKRLVYRLAWATETYTNSSYTTGDANSGFIYYHGTY